MNRFVKYENIKVDLGRLVGNEMVINSASIFNDEFKLSVSDKYFENNNCYIVCELFITHRVLKERFGLKRKDLYYLNSDKQTITKQDILDTIISSDIIKTIIVENRVDLK